MNLATFRRRAREIFDSIPAELRHGVSGTAADVEIEAREIIRMRERINRIFARETGQTLERIESDTHRNFWLMAEQAKEYGLVGKVINSESELS